MRLLPIALLAAATLAQAQTPAAEAERLVLDASRALQAGNAARFLSYCDKKAMDDFPVLRQKIATLANQRDIASSVDVSISETDGSRITLDVDWLLQLTWTREVADVERRQAVIQVTVETAGEQPRIVSIAPTDLFNPTR